MTHKGTLPDKCPSCKVGELEYDTFEVEGMYYPVSCLNEECNARFWESPESKEEWDEIE